jgi:hypothetical protein
VPASPVVGKDLAARQTAAIGPGNTNIRYRQNGRHDRKKGREIKELVPAKPAGPEGEKILRRL